MPAVDTRSLVEEGQQESEHYREQVLAREQAVHGELALRAPNLRDRLIDPVGVADREDGPTATFVILAQEQPARALRDARDEQQKGQRRQHLDAHHPAPTEAGELGQEVVGEECDQDAENELELGTTIDDMPTPTPPTKRMTAKNQGSVAIADPRADTRYKTPIRMRLFLRPIRSHGMLPVSAPITVPHSAEDMTTAP
jgi:hypothetical protein